MNKPNITLWVVGEGASHPVKGDNLVVVDNIPAALEVLKTGEVEELHLRPPDKPDESWGYYNGVYICVPILDCIAKDSTVPWPKIYFHTVLFPAIQKITLNFD